MLKLSLKPGESIRIGEDIRVVYAGGSASNIKIMVDAPREYEILRNTLEKESSRAKSYRPEEGISQEAHEEIVKILKREKYKNHIAKKQLQNNF